MDALSVDVADSADRLDVFSPCFKREVEERFNDVVSILPCTPLQDSMLSVEDPTSNGAYFNQIVFKIHGNVEYMRNAWQAMIARHAILRTRFIPTGDSRISFAQVVLGESPLVWQYATTDDMSASALARVSKSSAISALEDRRPPYVFTVYSHKDDKEGRALVLSMPHALYDSAALTQLLRDVEATYKGLPLDAPVSVQPFIAHTRFSSNEQSSRYWKAYLQDFQPTTFPDLTGKSTAFRSTLSAYKVTDRFVDLPLSQIQLACKENAVTLLSICQATWAKVLSMYLGELDICFGNVISGRSVDVAGVERLVMPCFNTLPTRVRLESATTNRHLLERVQGNNAESFEYQLSSLRRIQSENCASQQPLFDTLVLVQQPLEKLDPSIWTFEADIGEMDFSVVCEFIPDIDDDRLNIRLHSRRSVILDNDIPLVLATLNYALRSCIISPASNALDFEELDSSVLSRCKNTYTMQDVGENSLLHHAFEQNVRQRPRAPALDFLDDDMKHMIWSYERLDSEARRIAQCLMQEDIQLEQPIPIHLPKSLAYYASVLGVLKAGACFTPFDTQAPPDRKKYMLDELGAGLIISDDNLDNSWCEAKILAVSRTFQEEPEHGLLPTSNLKPSNLAYHIYTSGSTGQPKAVSVEHQSAVQTIAASKTSFRWKLDSRLLQFASTTFDMCYYDCFMAWSYGFCLCAASQTMMFNDLPAIIDAVGATILDLTPSVASSLQRKDIPSVDFLYCIGEQMRNSIIDEWEGSCVNSFGPAEAAMAVSIFPVDGEANPSVIGEPFATTSFHVRQKVSDFLAPVLGIGELYLGGSQLARGYHGKAEMTKSRFVVENGQRYYKTGDVVRHLGNGTYEFVGRADSQVKIRGLRVELDEITSIVKMSSDAIADASTHVLKASESAKDQLVTFVTLNSRYGSTSEQTIRQRIRDFAAKKLPSYMMPTVILIIDRIPLSASGKIDVQALLRSYRDNAEAQSSEITPDRSVEPTHEWTDSEQQVRRVLSNVSSIHESKIVIDTNIFSLGLDSISAMQISKALAQRGLATSASMIMQSPTVGGIAGTVTTEDELTKLQRTPRQQPTINLRAFDVSHRAQICERYDIRSAHVAAVRPCTSLQAGMIVQLLHSKSLAYVYHATFQLNDATDMQALCEAWDAVLENYKMLRTGFATVDDRQHPFTMITYRARAVSLPVSIIMEQVEIGGWRQQCADDIVSALHRTPWRVLLHTSGTQKRMELSIFHGLYDATSLRHILTDVARAVHGHLSLEPPPSLDRALIKILQGNSSTDSEVEQYWKSLASHVTASRFPELSPLHSSGQKLRVACLSSSSPMSQLQDRCRAANVTMQIAGQAAWARVLSAYLGEPSITFGTVLSGRVDNSMETAPFPCITTIPVPVNASQSDTLLLQSLMQFMTKSHSFQYVPLPTIQRWVGHQNTALFDSLFVYQKHDLSEDEISLPWRVIDEEVATDYPVSLEVEPSSDDMLQYSLTFQEDRIPEAQAVQMLKQFDYVLQSIIKPAPSPSTSSSETCDTALWSITPAKHDFLPSEISLLHEVVEAGAAKHPSKVALEFYTSLAAAKCEKRSWTYAELDIAGNQVAHFLSQQGISQGSIVGVCFNKCPEASFTMLGILKAGCAFLALDTGAPPARKSFILKDSGAAAVISTQSIARGIHGFEAQLACPLIMIDEADTGMMPTTKVKLARAVISQDTSYCLYTSGTTGTPKGCELSHLNAVQFLLAFQRILRWGNDSCFLQFASFHFDVSVMEQYWSWSVGIRVASAPRDVIFEDLAGAIRNMNITHLDLTPSLASLLDPQDVPSLCGKNSVFITGGESLKTEIIERWGPHEVIHNGYGPTEATIGCTMYPGVPSTGLPSNIGCQFDNVGTYVLEPCSIRPVLRGAIGELCVSGALVAKGYLNRPDLTTERFPSIELNGQVIRVYRTGDLVRILHDNSFQFLGRADDQVKLRGQRLEIGEINSVIKQSDNNIQDVATLVLKPAEQHTEHLVSFVVSKHSPSPSAKSEVEAYYDVGLSSAVQNSCRAELPAYMIPTHVLPITSLPLTANNKVDMNKLKQVYAEIDRGILDAINGDDAASEPPWTEHEEAIASILANYTGAERDSIKHRSSVFKLGIDSISVIGLISALRDGGFQQASISSVMRNSTVMLLARALDMSNVAGTTTDDAAVSLAKQEIVACERRHKGSAAKILAVGQSDIECIAPCTPLQQGIISRSLGSDKPLYFAEFRFDLLEIIDLIRLKQAWASVVERVQVLRTRFVVTDDGHIQIVVKSTAPPWVESEAVSAEDAESLLDDQYQSWYQRNQRQLHEPVRIVAARYSGGCKLSLNVFHGIYDGISLPLIMRLVLGAYHGADTSSIGPNFHSTLAYGPLRTVEGAKTFWLEHLRQSQNALRKLPCSSDKPASDDTVLTTTMSNLHGLEDCRRTLGTTHQALIQACWTAVIHKHFGRPVVLGMVVSGRSIEVEDVSRTIGPLFNTIPFYLELSSSFTWATFVEKCHEFNTAAIPYQHTPLRDIAKWCRQLSPPLSRPMFETLFVFQKAEQEDEYPPIWSRVSDKIEADYPLAFEVEHASDGSLNLTLVAKSNIVNVEALQELEGNFRAALTALVTDPEATITKTLDIMGDAPGDMANSIANGNDKRRSNGHQANGKSGRDSNFRSSPTSEHIRDEIAILCNLEKADVNPHKSILELGLDSIDAVKLSSRLSRAIDIRLPVSEIMRSLTVAKMSEQVARSLDDSDSSDTVRDTDYLKREESRLRRHLLDEGLDFSYIERVLPVTPLQEAIIAQMLASDWKEYFNHDILWLEEGAEPRRLEQAWQQVIDKNPILRTAFYEITDSNIDTIFAQIVRKPKTLEWRTQYGSVYEANEIEERLRVEVEHAPKAEPPIRLTWLKDARTELITHYVISLSHAMYDGWSLGLLHADVRRAYHDIPTQRTSYDRALKAILKTNASNEAKDYWKSALKDASPALLAKREQTTQEPSALHRKERVSTTTLKQAQEFCRTHGVTIGALARTVWAQVLASNVHSFDVIFGVVLSCRDDEHTNEVMFPTMNTVAVRSTIHGSRSDMVREMQSNMAEMAPYKHFPLRRVQALTEGHGNLFDTLFIYQKGPEGGDDEQATNKLYESVGSASDVEYPICVEIEASKDQLLWRNACKGEYLDKEGADTLLQRLDEVLARIISDPESPCISQTDEGISLCGQPRFKKPRMADESTSANGHPVKHNEQTNSEAGIYEATIISTLAQVARLAEDEVSSSSTIFSLGLDSILAIKVSNLLSKRGIKLRQSDMLKAGTVSNMARVAISADESGNEASDRGAITAPNLKENESLIRSVLGNIDTTTLLAKLGIREAQVECILPATAGQAYMLSMYQISGLFYATFKYNTVGELSVEDLRRAWYALVEHNPILRTIFLATGHGKIPFLQLVQRHVGTAAERNLNDFGSVAEEVVESPTPFVALYATRGVKGWSLLLRIHHALYDGVSLPMLLEQLEALSNEPQTKSLPSSTSFITDMLGSSLSKPAVHDRKTFWRSYLSGLETTRLPYSCGTKQRSLSRVRIELYDPSLLSTSETSSLKRSVRNANVSIQALFLVAYAKVYAKSARRGSLMSIETDEQNVLIGVYLANRSQPEAANSTYPTLNLVPLRVRKPLGRPLYDLAREVQYHLGQIAQGSRNAVALWELEHWIGDAARCDTWVNFVSAGNDGDWPAPAITHDSERIRIRETEDSAKRSSERYERVVDLPRPDDEDEDTMGKAEREKRVSELLHGNTVSEAYVSAVDLEAAVRGGKLAVGLFCDESLHSIEKAKEMMGEIRVTLVDGLEMFVG